MGSDLFFENKKYIPAKDAAALTGYSKDYVGQLCRGNKVLSKRIGHTWYVCEESILNYKSTPTAFDYSQNLKPKVTSNFVPSTAVSIEATITPTENKTEDSASASSQLNEDSSVNLIPVKVVESKVRKISIPSDIKVSRKNIRSPYSFGSRFVRNVAPSVLAIIFVISLIGSFSNSYSSFNKIGSGVVGNFTAAVVNATNVQSYNALDHAGAVVYNGVVNWFDKNIYSKVAGLLGNRNIVVTNINSVSSTTTKTTIFLFPSNPATFE
jgi:hypothetical protein